MKYEHGAIEKEIGHGCKFIEFCSFCNLSLPAEAGIESQQRLRKRRFKIRGKMAVKTREMLERSSLLSSNDVPISAVVIF
jgi:hypothetical protein